MGEKGLGVYCEHCSFQVIHSVLRATAVTTDAQMPLAALSDIVLLLLILASCQAEW